MGLDAIRHACAPFAMDFAVFGRFICSWAATTLWTPRFEARSTWYFGYCAIFYDSTSRWPGGYVLCSNCLALLPLISHNFGTCDDWQYAARYPVSYNSSKSPQHSHHSHDYDGTPLFHPSHDIRQARVSFDCWADKTGFCHQRYWDKFYWESFI